MKPYCTAVAARRLFAVVVVGAIVGQPSRSSFGHGISAADQERIFSSSSRNSSVDPGASPDPLPRQAGDGSNPHTCRVAVCISGYIQSFVYPVVHRSIRTNLVEAIEKTGGCTVEVFAYATAKDTTSQYKQDANTEFSPGTDDIKAAMMLLAPTRLVWHREQAGIIPNSCRTKDNRLLPRTNLSTGNIRDIGDSDSTEDDWFEEVRENVSASLYWQLYGKLGAYRMALDEEQNGFKYDWIVSTRFDMVWTRPLPPLLSFSNDAVWFGTRNWPMSDDFALVPREFADRFFLAISAFYGCDEPSWPPSESWWQPKCMRTGFQESVLFRHLHFAEVPYRLYPHFEYSIARGTKLGIGCNKQDATEHFTACVALNVAGVLSPGLHSSIDCVAVLSDWSNLRCRALLQAGGIDDPSRIAAIIDPDPRAWETLIPAADTLRTAWPGETAEAPKADGREGGGRGPSTLHSEFTDVPTRAEIGAARSKLFALRDAIAIVQQQLDEHQQNNRVRGNLVRETAVVSLDERGRWDGFEKNPPWWLFSIKTCSIDGYRGPAPHVLYYSTMANSLVRELAAAFKCHLHILAGGDNGARTGGGGTEFDAGSCARLRSLEEVAIDVSLHVEELGVCSTDPSLGLSWPKQVNEFFREPTRYCVGYGRLSAADKYSSPAATDRSHYADESDRNWSVYREERSTLHEQDKSVEDEEISVEDEERFVQKKQPSVKYPEHPLQGGVPPTVGQYPLAFSPAVENHPPSSGSHIFKQLETQGDSAVKVRTVSQVMAAAATGVGGSLQKGSSQDLFLGEVPQHNVRDVAGVVGRKLVAVKAEEGASGFPNAGDKVGSAEGREVVDEECGSKAVVGAANANTNTDAHRDGELGKKNNEDVITSAMLSSPYEGRSCSALLVRSMEVVHPKEGTVYWEGPVEVQLVAEFSGPGVEGLNLHDVHVCAETLESWPLSDSSRSCMSLTEMASPNYPPLVFGTAIGVVMGSVTLWDARPGCMPRGSLENRQILPIAVEGGKGNDGRRDRHLSSVIAGDGEEGEWVNDSDEVASRRIKFKVIHHRSFFERRGRPMGPKPLGRGSETVELFIAELEKDSDEEYSFAIAEMEDLSRGVYGPSFEFGSQLCLSNVNVKSRGNSIASAGFHLVFIAEQLEWMLANRKLPAGMALALDRIRELQMTPEFTVDENKPGLSKPFPLGYQGWRKVAPFFQRFLVLPMPAKENVLTEIPLTTREYDEIPWMEALNPAVDWHAVEEAYLGNLPVEITYVDNFFSQPALDKLRGIALGSTIFFDGRILGRGTPGWPLGLAWFYVYGGNNEDTCTSGIKVHADAAMVNLNIWLAPDSANLGSAKAGDGGGLTIFHAKPPDHWEFREFNRNASAAEELIRESQAGNTSVEHCQNRALMFNSMLFHQSDPFRFKKGFENRRINLTLLFGKKPWPGSSLQPKERRELEPEEAGTLLYCL